MQHPLTYIGADTVYLAAICIFVVIQRHLETCLLYYTHSLVFWFFFFLRAFIWQLTTAVFCSSRRFLFIITSFSFTFFFLSYCLYWIVKRYWLTYEKLFYLIIACLKFLSFFVKILHPTPQPTLKNGPQPKRIAHVTLNLVAPRSHQDLMKPEPLPLGLVKFHFVIPFPAAPTFIFDCQRSS